MTQVEKDILLKDISARLPYGLKCSIYRVDDFGVGWRVAIFNGVVLNDYGYEFYFDDYVCVDSINKVKPYLFPMSSMTEDQANMFGLLQAESIKCEFLYPCNCANLMKFIYENHLDYMDLIGKGLALDATDKNIY